nr:family 20 glycosylhydrolase [uncultured Prevotella sp.]
MATTIVSSLTNLLQKNLLFQNYKNKLDAFFTVEKLTTKTVLTLLIALLLSQIATAQNFRTLRDVKVNETTLDLSQSDCKIIPRNAMHSCHRLTSVQLPPNLDSIGTQAFFACDGIAGQLHFPATTRVIEASAFNGCRQLNKLSFEGSTRIGAFAFANCRGLREVHLSATVPPVCADNAFDGVNLRRVKLIVPTQAKQAYRKAMGWRNFFSTHKTENVCNPEQLLVPRPLTLKVYSSQAPLKWASVTGIDAPKELNNERIQAERILSERTTYKKGKKKTGVRIIIALDKSLTDHEAYTLEVNNNRLTIKGRTATAVFNALMTLEQLCIGNGISARSEQLPALYIADKPRTAIRELMVDPVRHFIPFEDLKGFVVEMARYKYNALHLHLVDDQAWRIEIKKYPELIAKGSDRVGMDDMPERISGYYTQEQMRELVRFAAQYHVMIIPEIELPGHEVAAVHCYPQLSCAKKPVPIRLTCGVSNELLCPAEPFVYEFLDNVFTELADVFPAPYVHLGGDEAGQPPLGAWSDCTACTALKQKEGYTENWQLQQHLFDRVIKKLHSLGKTPMYWYEKEFKTIQPGCVVYAWRHGLTKTAIDAAVRNKAKIMLCPGEHCYLDYPQQRGDMPEKNWGMPVTTLEQTYRLDPAWGQDSVFVQNHLLGVSGTLWSECINSTERIYYQAFPRAAALAEAGWTVPERRSYKEFLTRVRPLTDDMLRRGIAVNVK